MVYIEEIKIKTIKQKSKRNGNFRADPDTKEVKITSYPKHNQNEDTKKRNYVEADNANDDNVSF